ncbi:MULTISPECIES: hypothetical protein [Rhodococcus]|uniref:hypothetical protein n=1 Tax=Rhodococcus TaxID=1827 RepID=UPI001DC760FC|nr:MULTISPECIES: hypothetical protein [Rhodococcus]MBW0288515.1 hypothetical protein [Rhodococcus sp. MH15]MEA1798745.1 hypothetical protein [Rhodococcus qingshengii]
MDKDLAVPDPAGAAARRSVVRCACAGLIAAGFMTEEENRPLSPTRKSLQQLSNKQILDEIRRRTAGDLGGPPIPVRVDGVLHSPDGPPTVFVSYT